MHRACILTLHRSFVLSQATTPPTATKNAQRFPQPPRKDGSLARRQPRPRSKGSRAVHTPIVDVERHMRETTESAYRLPKHLGQEVYGANKADRVARARKQSVDQLRLRLAGLQIQRADPGVALALTRPFSFDRLGNSAAAIHHLPL